jgi:hypothetical protein|nr:MAG TPA: hypothetical protein [Caudoviricetes sp.]
MSSVTVSKDKVDTVLRDAVINDRTYREILVQLLQLSSYRVDSMEYIKLLAVYSDKRFLRELKKIIK